MRKKSFTELWACCCAMERSEKFQIDGERQTCTNRRKSAHMLLPIRRYVIYVSPLIRTRNTTSCERGESEKFNGTHTGYAQLTRARSNHDMFNFRNECFHLPRFSIQPDGSRQSQIDVCRRRYRMCVTPTWVQHVVFSLRFCLCLIISVIRNQIKSRIWLCLSGVTMWSGLQITEEFLRSRSKIPMFN